MLECSIIACILGFIIFFISGLVQMMSIEWFGTIDPRLRFTADNLSDYSRYFNEYDYTESADEEIEGS